jgi:hypothetical protein
MVIDLFSKISTSRFQKDLQTKQQRTRGAARRQSRSRPCARRATRRAVGPSSVRCETERCRLSGVQTSSARGQHEFNIPVAHYRDCNTRAHTHTPETRVAFDLDLVASEQRERLHDGNEGRVAAHVHLCALLLFRHA